MESRFLTKIHLVDDDSIMSRAVQRALENDGNVDVKLFENGKDFLNSLHENPDIAIIDYRLPDMDGMEILKKVKQSNEDTSIIMMSGQDKLEVVVDAYNSGAHNYVIKDGHALVELRNTVKNLYKNVNYRKEIETLKDFIVDRHKYNRIIGESEAILKVLKLIQKVENKNVTVLVTGETGTGKDLAAKAIHYNSSRKRKAFVTVNMPAIPADLVESELFGYEKGAFTGADSRRIGKFEEANGGTIFLDEIGDMDIKLQSKILRVLQEMQVTRLGSNKVLDLDLRVIAATNCNLAEKVKDGTFREDLYYRLQGFIIKLPPLRDRNNDVLHLAKYFLTKFCEDNKLETKIFTNEAMKLMINHSWPGNVRELKSLVERSALMSESNRIDPDDLVFS